MHAQNLGVVIIGQRKADFGKTMTNFGKARCMRSRYQQEGIWRNRISINMMICGEAKLQQAQIWDAHYLTCLDDVCKELQRDYVHRKRGVVLCVCVCVCVRERERVETQDSKKTENTQEDVYYKGDESTCYKV